MGCCYSKEQLDSVQEEKEPTQERKEKEPTQERKEFESSKNNSAVDQFPEQILKRIEDVIGMIEEDQINCEKWHKDVINGLNEISSPLLQNRSFV